MAKKYKLTVIYGTEACNYLYDGHTLKTTMKKIDEGTIFGDYHEYIFDTENDRLLAENMLEDALGWDNNAWEEKTIGR